MKLLFKNFFDDSQEIRSAFLDIPKTFDKVWRKGLIFKFKQNGFLGIR